MGDYAVIGEVLGDQYEVLGVLGQGTFGRVYRARDRSTGEVVALKEFVKKRGRAGGFLRELGISFELRHPNIVDCHTLFMSGDYRYLVCEYMDGGSLRDALSSDRFGTRELVGILLDVVSGVACAHERNVIHRDLKPENVLLARRNGRHVAKVSDFGIATLGSSIDARSCIGSPAYMAPEQFYDQYDARVDVYALGVMLYEILCGKRPFHGSPAQLMTSHIRREPELPIWLPKLFARVIKKALAKKPDRRYSCVEAFGEAVRLALDAEGAGLERDGSPGEFSDLLSVAHSGDEILVQTRSRFMRLDTKGRIIHEDAPVDLLLSARSSYAVVRGTTATVKTVTGFRAHRGLPENAHLALAADGTLSAVHDGAVTLFDASGAHPMTPPGKCATAACFLGSEQTLCVAWEDGPSSVVSLGGSEIPLPHRATSLFGHPSRYELVARGDGNRLMMARLGGVTEADVSCGDFTCDGEAFFAVGEDGDLVRVHVAASRVGRTRWQSKLKSVSAGDDRFVWATREGRVLCT